MIPKVLDRRVVTYGFSPQADVRGVDLRTTDQGVAFAAVLTDRKSGQTRTIGELFLPMFGRHNVQNALSVVGIANELKISDAVLRRALAAFEGVNRRFTRTGEVDGITIIDDYAHHPVEITAVLAAARSVSRGRVIAVVQPHRYSRLHNLFEEFCSCFNDADAVIVADVYAAGEEPIEGTDRDALVEGLRARGHRLPLALTQPESLAETVNSLVGPGDIVVCLGAGSITRWAHDLPEQLQALRHRDDDIRPTANAGGNG